MNVEVRRMCNKNKRSDLKYKNKLGDAKRISRQLIAIFHSVQLRPRDYLKSFQSARTCSSFRVSLHILDDLVSPIFVAIQLHGYSFEYRESPLRFSSRNEPEFPLLNFHEPALAYGPASRNLHCSPKLPPKHSRHIGISRYLFLRGQWRSWGGAHERFSSGKIQINSIFRI